MARLLPGVRTCRPLRLVAVRSANVGRRRAPFRGANSDKDSPFATLFALAFRSGAFGLTLALGFAFLVDP